MRLTTSVNFRNRQPCVTTTRRRKFPDGKILYIMVVYNDYLTYVEISDGCCLYRGVECCG